VKRYIRNFIAFLIIVVILAGAYQFYDPSQAEIQRVMAQGDTNKERVESIAALVQERHKGFVVVTSARISTAMDGTRSVVYIMAVTVSASVYVDRPQTQQQLQRQMEAQRHVSGAIVDLLRLTTIHLLEYDPTITSVALRISLPNGNASSGMALMEQLQRIPPGAPDEAWLEAIRPLAVG